MRRPGLVATASTAAWPGRNFEAAISEISTAIDPVSRSFIARARIANHDGALAPGMFMRLNLELARHCRSNGAEEAVTVEGPDAFVFVVNDGKAERRTVKTGGRQPGWVQITDGVSAGEEVVFSGTSKVRPGGAVKVVNAEASASGAGAALQGHPMTLSELSIRRPVLAAVMSLLIVVAGLAFDLVAPGARTARRRYVRSVRHHHLYRRRARDR